MYLLALLFTLSTTQAQAGDSLLQFIAKTGAKINQKVQNAVNAYLGEDGDVCTDSITATPDPVDSTPIPVASAPIYPPSKCNVWGDKADDIVTDILIGSDSSADAKASRADCFAWALEHGANVNGSDPGMRPLILAIRGGFPELATILLNQGADPNVVDDKGLSALAFAGFNMEDEVMSLMLQKGADPNLNDQQHSSALFAAVIRGNSAQVRMLLAHGAKSSPALIMGSDESNKQTPLDQATEDIDFLKGYIAKRDAAKDADTKSDINYQIGRIQEDHSPGKNLDGIMPSLRSIDQILTEQYAIQELLKSKGATCAQDPCGGISTGTDTDTDTSTDGLSSSS